MSNDSMLFFESPESDHHLNDFSRREEAFWKSRRELEQIKWNSDIILNSNKKRAEKDRSYKWLIHAIPPMMNEDSIESKESISHQVTTFLPSALVLNLLNFSIEKVCQQCTWDQFADDALLYECLSRSYRMRKLLTNKSFYDLFRYLLKQLTQCFPRPPSEASEKLWQQTLFSLLSCIDHFQCSFPSFTLSLPRSEEGISTTPDYAMELAQLLEDMRKRSEEEEWKCLYVLFIRVFMKNLEACSSQERKEKVISLLSKMEGRKGARLCNKLLLVAVEQSDSEVMNEVIMENEEALMNEVFMNYLGSGNSAVQLQAIQILCNALSRVDGTSIGFIHSLLYIMGAVFQRIKKVEAIFVNALLSALPKIVDSPSLLSHFCLLLFILQGKFALSSFLPSIHNILLTAVSLGDAAYSDLSSLEPFLPSYASYQTHLMALLSEKNQPSKRRIVREEWLSVLVSLPYADPAQICDQIAEWFEEEDKYLNYASISSSSYATITAHLILHPNRSRLLFLLLSNHVTARNLQLMFNMISSDAASRSYFIGLLKKLLDSSHRLPPQSFLIPEGSGQLIAKNEVISGDGEIIRFFGIPDFPTSDYSISFSLLLLSNCDGNILSLEQKGYAIDLFIENRHVIVKYNQRKLNEGWPADTQVLYHFFISQNKIDFLFAINNEVVCCEAITPKPIASSMQLNVGWHEGKASFIGYCNAIQVYSEFAQDSTLLDEASLLCRFDASQCQKEEGFVYDDVLLRANQNKWMETKSNRHILKEDVKIGTIFGLINNGVWISSNSSILTSLEKVGGIATLLPLLQYHNETILSVSVVLTALQRHEAFQREAMATSAVPIMALFLYSQYTAAFCESIDKEMKRFLTSASVLDELKEIFKDVFYVNALFCVDNRYWTDDRLLEVSYLASCPEEERDDMMSVLTSMNPSITQIVPLPNLSAAIPALHSIVTLVRLCLLFDWNEEIEQSCRGEMEKRMEKHLWTEEELKQCFDSLTAAIGSFNQNKERIGVALCMEILQHVTVSEYGELHTFIIEQMERIVDSLERKGNQDSEVDQLIGNTFCNEHQLLLYCCFSLYMYCIRGKRGMYQAFVSYFQDSNVYRLANTTVLLKYPQWYYHLSYTAEDWGDTKSLLLQVLRNALENPTVSSVSSVSLLHSILSAVYSAFGIDRNEFHVGIIVKPVEVEDKEEEELLCFDTITKKTKLVNMSVKTLVRRERSRFTEGLFESFYCEVMKLLEGHSECLEEMIGWCRMITLPEEGEKLESYLYNDYMYSSFLFASSFLYASSFLLQLFQHYRYSVHYLSKTSEIDTDEKNALIKECIANTMRVMEQMVREKEGWQSHFDTIGIVMEEVMKMRKEIPKTLIPYYSATLPSFYSALQNVADSLIALYQSTISESQRSEYGKVTGGRKASLLNAIIKELSIKEDSVVSVSPEQRHVMRRQSIPEEKAGERLIGWKEQFMAMQRSWQFLQEHVFRKHGVWGARKEEGNISISWYLNDVGSRSILQRDGKGNKHEAASDWTVTERSPVSEEEEKEEEKGEEKELEEDVLFQESVLLIKPMMAISGVLRITKERLLYVVSKEYEESMKEKRRERQREIENGKKGENIYELMIPQIRGESRWIEEVKEEEFRTYLNEEVAIELFYGDKASSLFVFSSGEARSLFHSVLRSHVKNALTPFLGETAAIRFKNDRCEEKWMRGELSNFAYLLRVNRLAGRSFNDLSQYPVFPWVLSDYTSDRLDLHNPMSYRDFAYPIGAQTEKRRQVIREKYAMLKEDMGNEENDPYHIYTPLPRHYSTLFSNSAIVNYYLLRIEPYTSYHIILQNGRLDRADRQFWSVQGAWQGSCTSDGDVKELIPELFDLESFAENVNQIDFGNRQTGESISQIVLPPWSSAPTASATYNFIYNHRMALESDYTRQHLHLWIDLVFGYKQRGNEAEQALNVYSHYCYYTASELKSIRQANPTYHHQLSSMLENFGQLPQQILTRPHKQALPQSAPVGEPRGSLESRGSWGSSTCLVVSPSSIQTMAITESTLHLMTANNRLLAQPIRVASQPIRVDDNDGVPDLDSISAIPHNRRMPSLQNGQRAISSHSGRFVVTIGNHANCLLFVDTATNEMIGCYSLVEIHVKCICLDDRDQIVYCGSAENALIILSLHVTEHRVRVVSEKRLFAHDGEVNCIDVDSRLNRVCSGGDDGKICVFLESAPKKLHCYADVVQPVKRVDWCGIGEKGVLLWYSGEDSTLRLQTQLGVIVNRVRLSCRFTCFQLGRMRSVLWGGGEHGNLVEIDTATGRVVREKQLDEWSEENAVKSILEHEGKVVIAMKSGKVIMVW